MDYVNEYLKNQCSLEEAYAKIANEVAREADLCYEDTETYDRLIKQKEQLQSIISVQYMKEHGYVFDESENYNIWKAK